MEERLHAWCDAVLGYIRFKPDRSCIREELEAHLEDKLERLTFQGMDREAAAERAVLEMGDPEVVGRALDQAHKRLLGWAWLLSKICAVGLALLLSCQLVSSGRHTRENLWERLRQQFQPIVYEPGGTLLRPGGRTARAGLYIWRPGVGASAGAELRLYPLRSLWNLVGLEGGGVGDRVDPAGPDGPGKAALGGAALDLGETAGAGRHRAADPIHP